MTPNGILPFKETEHNIKPEMTSTHVNSSGAQIQTYIVIPRIILQKQVLQNYSSNYLIRYIILILKHSIQYQ